MEERLMQEYIEREKVSPSVMAALASAVFEWFLIFLLFIEASFSYLVTKFACYCNLQTPCLLCSRLDHILGKGRAGFYWDLICRNHKLKISSLVHCHLHSKLVDVHGMCETCLISFASVNKSNAAETYRLLLGKLGAERLLQDRLLGVGVPTPDSSATTSTSATSTIVSCCCCNEKWISTQQLFHSKSIEPKEAGHDKRLSLTVKDDPLPYVEYRKVKITTSDSEARISVSDYESATKRDLAAECLLPDPCIITQADDSVSEKVILPDSSLPEVKLGDVDAPSTTVAATTDPVGRDSEFKGQQIEHTFDVSCSPELLISSDEVLHASHNNVACSTDASETCKVVSQSILTSEAQVILKSDTSETTSSRMLNSLDLGDAYKIALGSHGRQLSGKLLEQRSLKESTRASEDFKLLLSQLSASRGSEILLTDMSPRLSGNMDELRVSSDAASTCVGMQILQKRISLERNESCLSLDGSMVSEIEGESVVDRLKRQVEHDKKLMSALYKELEEERSASAVAANQAMAMITRLQEEKATFHMEALQCLRMMEEQAEYDVEALQKANNLLEEKEKEVQDLASKLELYKIKFGKLSLMDNMVNSRSDDPILRDIGVEDVDGSPARSSTSIFSGSNSYNKQDDICCNKMNELTKPIQENNAENILVEFKGERLYLLDCLRELDKNLQQLLCDGTEVLEKSSPDFSVEDSIINWGTPQWDEEMHEEDHTQKGTVTCVELPFVDGESASTSTYHNDTKEDAEWKHGKHAARVDELNILRKEFSVLNSRLEALETETNFLEHSFNSLKNGGERLKCIEEMGRHLRDLHLSIISRRRC